MKDLKKDGLAGGVTKKESFHKTKPESLGMGYHEKSQKPKGNPAHKTSDGHVIK